MMPVVTTNKQRLAMFRARLRYGILDGTEQLAAPAAEARSVTNICDVLRLKKYTTAKATKAPGSSTADDRANLTM